MNKDNECGHLEMVWSYDESERRRMQREIRAKLTRLNAANRRLRHEFRRRPVPRMKKMRKFARARRPLFEPITFNPLKKEDQ